MANTETRNFSQILVELVAAFALFLALLAYGQPQILMLLQKDINQSIDANTTDHHFNNITINPDGKISFGSDANYYFDTPTGMMRLDFAAGYPVLWLDENLFIGYNIGLGSWGMFSRGGNAGMFFTDIGAWGEDSFYFNYNGGIPVKYGGTGRTDVSHTGDINMLANAAAGTGKSFSQRFTSGVARGVDTNITKEGTNDIFQIAGWPAATPINQMEVLRITGFTKGMWIDDLNVNDDFNITGNNMAIDGNFLMKNAADVWKTCGINSGATTITCT